MALTRTRQLQGPRDDSTLGLMGAAIAVTGWGLSSVLAKKVNLGGLSVATYRFGIFVAIILVWRLARRQGLTRSDFRNGFWGGIALGADVAFFFSAIKLTSVVNATVIGALQPVVVSVYAWRFVGERLRPREMVLSSMALVGVVTVVVTGSSGAEGDWRGDLLAVGALGTWSAYFIISKRMKGVVAPGAFTVVTAVVTTAMCAPLALAFGQSLAPPAAIDWLWLCIMAIGAGVVGHNLMNWSLVRIPLWLGSTMTLLIAPTSTLLAWALLGETINVAQGLAIGLVMVALALLVLGQTANTPR